VPAVNCFLSVLWLVWLTKFEALQDQAKTHFPIEGLELFSGFQNENHLAKSMIVIQIEAHEQVHPSYSHICNGIDVGFRASICLFRSWNWQYVFARVDRLHRDVGSVLWFVLAQVYWCFQKTPKIKTR
jgi:hypothetical protein